MLKLSAAKPVMALRILFIVLFVLFLNISVARASNPSKIVEVCNKGNVTLLYITFGTKSHWLTGKQAKVAGWYSIAPRKCMNVNPFAYDGVAVGFIYSGETGDTFNPVYHFTRANRRGFGKGAPEIICVPLGKFNESGNMPSLQRVYSPPCRRDYHALDMSFFVQPNDQFVTLNVKPDKSTRRRPWISKSTNNVFAPPYSDLYALCVNENILPRQDGSADIWNTGVRKQCQCITQHISNRNYALDTARIKNGLRYGEDSSKIFERLIDDETQRMSLYGRCFPEELDTFR